MSLISPVLEISRMLTFKCKKKKKKKKLSAFEAVIQHKAFGSPYVHSDGCYDELCQDLHFKGLRADLALNVQQS